MSENEKHRIALAKTIRKFRLMNNVKRQYIAACLNVSVSSIDKMEQSITHPNFGQVYLLCKALNTSMQDFTIVFENELNKLAPPLSKSG